MAAPRSLIPHTLNYLKARRSWHKLSNINGARSIRSSPDPRTQLRFLEHPEGLVTARVCTRVSWGPCRMFNRSASRVFHTLRGEADDGADGNGHAKFGWHCRGPQFQGRQVHRSRPGQSIRKFYEPRAQRRPIVRERCGALGDAQGGLPRRAAAGDLLGLQGPKTATSGE